MKKSTKEWTEAVIEAGIVLLILFIFLWPVRVEGISMENTFHNADRVAVSRITAWLKGYEKGDIVVFSIQNKDKKENLIKRMIADEGDRVKISQGRIYINDKEIVEQYAVGTTKEELELTVPKGQVFVMGDNREHSMDSRTFGTISKKIIFGKVIVKWYPFDEIEGY